MEMHEGVCYNSTVMDGHGCAGRDVSKGMDDNMPWMCRKRREQRHGCAGRDVSKGMDGHGCAG